MKLIERNSGKNNQKVRERLEMKKKSEVKIKFSKYRTCARGSMFCAAARRFPMQDFKEKHKELSRKESEKN